MTGIKEKRSKILVELGRFLDILKSSESTLDVLSDRNGINRKTMGQLYLSCINFMTREIEIIKSLNEDINKPADELSNDVKTLQKCMWRHWENLHGMRKYLNDNKLNPKFYKSSAILFKNVSDLSFLIQDIVLDLTSSDWNLPFTNEYNSNLFI